MKRACVVLVTRDDGKVLAVSRGVGSKLWALPGGKCEDEKNEDTQHCAVRELYEETGLVLEAPRLLYQARNDDTDVFAYVGDAHGKVRGSDEGDVAWKDPAFLVDPEHSAYPAFTFNLFRSAGLMKHTMDLGLDDVHAPSAGGPPKKVPMADLTTKRRDALPSGKFADPKNRAYPIHDPAHIRNAAARLEQQKRTMTRGQYEAIKGRIARAAKKMGVDSMYNRRGSQRMSLTIDHPRHGRIEIRHMKGAPDNHALDVVLLDGKDGPAPPADQVHWYVMGIDDQAVQLAAKGEEPVWIQLAIPGTYCQNGKWFELNDKVFEDVVRNFNQTQNQHVPVDFEHASEQPGSEGQIPMVGAPAQGWILKLEHRGGKKGLWGLTKWGDLAREYIRNQNYRYISPTVRFNQRSRTTGEPIGALLSSAGLVNIPFLDGMKPLTAKDGQMPEAIDSDQGGSYAPTFPVTFAAKASERAFPPSEYMPKLRACMRMGELSTAAECRDNLDRLRQHYEAGGRDVNATPHGVQLSQYMLPLRDAVGAGAGMTWDDVFDQVEEMIDEAMQEHVEEYHEGAAAKLDMDGAGGGDDGGGGEAMRAKDAAEAVASKDTNAIEAIASPTGVDHMAETIEVQLKNVQDERAELAVKLKNAETSLVDVGLQLKSVAAELSTAKTKAAEAEAQVAALKAEVEKRDDQAVKDEVDAALLAYKDTKGVGEADRADMTALLKASPALFRKQFPKVPPALAHLTRVVTAPKGNVAPGAEAPVVQLKNDADASGVVDQKVLIAKYQAEGATLEDAVSRAFVEHSAQLASAQLRR